MLDAQEEAKALQRQQENPFAAMQQGIMSGYRDSDGNGYKGLLYSRYELSAAWGSIRARIADEGDFAFSVALNDSVLETGDQQATPFQVRLTYVGDMTKGEIWGIRQMEEHPDYMERLKGILESCLQTPVDLSIQTRGYTESELHLRRQAQMTPYQLDLQNDTGLSRLKELFTAELIYSSKSKRQILEPTQPSESDQQIQEQEQQE